MAKNGFFKKTFRKAKTAASEKYEEYKKDKAQERAATKTIRAKAKAAGYKEKETQAIRYAREKEKYKTSRRIKAMKDPKTTGFAAGLSYLAGPPSKKGPNISSMLGTGNGLQMYAKRATGKSRKKRKDIYSIKL
mgnify:CR=1 FL=1